MASAADLLIARVRQQLAQRSGQQQPPAQVSPPSPTAAQKRPRTSEPRDDASSSNDQRPSKRRRTSPDGTGPPTSTTAPVARSPLSSGLQAAVVSLPPPPPSAAPSEEVAGSAVLTAHAQRASMARARWFVSSKRERRACFLCDFARHHHTLELSLGGDRALFTEMTYGYDMMIAHYEEHHASDKRDLSEALFNIYEKHIRVPAEKAARGQRTSFIYPKQTPLDFFIHLEEHNRDVEYAADKNIRLVQDIIHFYSQNSALYDKDGLPNLNTGKLLLQAAGTMSKLIQDQRRVVAASGGAGRRQLRIDPHKVFSIASTRPLEAFQRQAVDALGGATATNTDAIVQNSAAQRPDFGALPDDLPDGLDDDEEGEEEEEEEAEAPPPPPPANNEEEEEEEDIDDGGSNGDAIDQFLDDDSDEDE